MIKPLVAEERLQSRREEIANSVSSGVGLIAIIGGIPFLLGSAIQHGGEFSLAGVIIFAATMVSLYLSSTIYHALPRTKSNGSSACSITRRSFFSLPVPTHRSLSEHCV